MATMHLSDRAVEKARSLIRSRQYVLDDSWGEANPGADEENRFLERHSWSDYAEWHLAEDPEAGEETKGRYRYPYGDFRRVHRSGLLAAKQRAAQNDHADVERAADELLTLLDETAS